MTEVECEVNAGAPRQRHQSLAALALLAAAAAATATAAVFGSRPAQTHCLASPSSRFDIMSGYLDDLSESQAAALKEMRAQVDAAIANAGQEADETAPVLELSATEKYTSMEARDGVVRRDTDLSLARLVGWSVAGSSLPMTASCCASCAHASSMCPRPSICTSLPVRELRSSECAQSSS